MNLWEDEANLFLEMELPGFSLEELEIAITENRLSLTGNPKEEVKESPPKREPVYHRKERRALKFSRVIELPSAVKTEQADAVLKNGVLTVRLPKAESAKRRKIAVSTAS
jgi:HSP20 family protein